MQKRMENNPSNTVNQLRVSELPIRLGQLLKLADFVQDGIEAKFYIQNGEVLVNQQPETRRGRKLQKNDVVTFRGKSVSIV